MSTTLLKPESDFPVNESKSCCAGPYIAFTMGMRISKAWKPLTNQRPVRPCNSTPTMNTMTIISKMPIPGILNPQVESIHSLILFPAMPSMML